MVFVTCHVGTAAQYSLDRGHGTCSVCPVDRMHRRRGKDETFTESRRIASFPEQRARVLKIEKPGRKPFTANLIDSPGYRGGKDYPDRSLDTVAVDHDRRMAGASSAKIRATRKGVRVWEEGPD